MPIQPGWPWWPVKDRVDSGLSLEGGLPRPFGSLISRQKDVSLAQYACLCDNAPALAILLAAPGPSAGPTGHSAGPRWSLASLAKPGSECTRFARAAEDPAVVGRNWAQCCVPAAVLPAHVLTLVASYQTQLVTPWERPRGVNKRDSAAVAPTLSGEQRARKGNTTNTEVSLHKKHGPVQTAAPMFPVRQMLCFVGLLLFLALVLL